MQKIFEPAFEILYLAVGLAISIFILVKSHKRLPYVLFGVMGLVLVFGDSFHLIPRIVNSWELGDANIYAYLGIGKLVTSITMTVFYLILFWFFKLRYQKKTPLALDLSLYALAAIRIVLCLLPYNDWTNKDAPYMWGIYRNIPFVLMGILLIVLCYRWAKEKEDKPFRLAYLAISLSFVFYIMTVTLAIVHTAFGMMMLPKTICYVWLLIMGIVAIRRDDKTATLGE